MAVLTDTFITRYLESLDDYKSFYDDIAVYGSPGDHQHAFYFIPGFNGTPGQFRFALPSLTRFFGASLYARCLHLPQFSSRVPIWEKYTTSNVAAKREMILQDLAEMTSEFETVTIVASSSGFYDLYATWPALDERARRTLRLVWVAAAPDWTESSRWEPIFSAINGFSHDGHNWFSYPNHNLLKFINNECSTDKTWRHGRQHKIFFKNDLESRFRLAGLFWDTISIDCYNWHTQQNIALGDRQIDIPAAVLVATHDGYWQKRPRGVIDSVIRRYLSDADIVYRATSHLWVTVPDNLTEIYAVIERKSPLLHLDPDVAPSASVIT